MRAAVFEGPGNIVVRDVTVPAVAADEILVRVESCGLCGGDIRNFRSGLRYGIDRQIMGHEITGSVAEVGVEVTRFRPGDRVALAPDVSCGECYYCRRGLVNLCVDHRMLGTNWPGGFAQYVHVPGIVLHRGFVEPLPDQVSFDEGALGEPAASVLACQEYNNVSLGDTVVVIGDGPVGCLHVEVARSRGASKVVLVGLTRLAAAAAFQPDFIIDAGTQDPVAEVRRITASLGADIAICANPVARTQQQAVEMVRKRGRVVLFGGVDRNDPWTPLNSNTIHYGEITVTGSFSYPSTGLEKALQAIAEGRISARKYISRLVDLEGITEGIRLAEKGEVLKVLVKPWGVPENAPGDVGGVRG